MDQEIFYCAHCPREQQKSKGEKCISCKRMTILWDKSRFSRDWAEKQWHEMRRYYGPNG